MAKDGTFPTADDFRAEFRRRLGRAQRAGHPRVDVKSGDLHRAVGGYPHRGGLHRMPVCCGVMMKAMRTGDEVVCSPPSGQGATLVIRYKLPR